MPVSSQNRCRHRSRTDSCRGHGRESFLSGMESILERILASILLIGSRKNLSVDLRGNGIDSMTVLGSILPIGSCMSGSVGWSKYKVCVSTRGVGVSVGCCVA